MTRFWTVLLAAAFLAVAPARADDSDDLEALLDDIDALPVAAIEADPEGWAEVLALLDAHLRDTGATPAPPAAAAAVADDPGLATALRRLIAAHRDIDPTDHTSRLFAAGVEPGAPPPAAGDALADLARSGAGLPGSIDFGAMQAFVASTDGGPLMRQVEVLNARAPDGAAMTQGVRESVDRLRGSLAQSGRELLDVRSAAAAMAGRLATLDGIVQRAAAIAGGDLDAGPAKLAQLRGELAGIRVRQAGPATPAQALPVAPAERSALVQQISQQLQALQQAGRGPVQALQVGRCELYLAVLDTLEREEQVRAAVLQQGRTASLALQQLDSERRRLTRSVERSPTP
ncbi:hypothetical protein [Rhizobacter sp. Root1221]|uniref:hypothetical protein n=1 Tax=Rhizobacter sp. Root1221 TaxID=1736433 RepID=UPI0006F88DBD|nr:hypothetical protein [Rhizobacter sp. Root1221]KQV92794.1 hypothetical protein ASC87_27885 [Rhizobacter sp. Root1221]